MSKIAAVAVGHGVFWNTTGGEPLLTLENSHISSYISGITLNEGHQFTISSNLIYARNDRTASWIGISVTGSYGTGGTFGGVINDNVINDVAGLSSATNGIVLASGVGSHTIAGNKINNVDTGVWVKSGSDNNIVSDNYVTNFSSNEVLNSGNNNTIRLVGSTTSFRGALVYLTSTSTREN